MSGNFEGQLKPSAIEVDGYEADLSASRYTEIPSNMQMRVAYDGSGNAQYVGYAPRGLDESTNGWLIQLFAYDGSSRCISRKIAYDSWSNRTGATYA